MKHNASPCIINKALPPPFRGQRANANAGTTSRNVHVEIQIWRLHV